MFIVFMVFIIFFVIINQKYLNSPADFGTYATPVVSECNVDTTKCDIQTTIAGTATSTRECVPNGRVGCLDPVTGNQTFASLSETVSCVYKCPSAKWITTRGVPCTYYYDELATQPVTGCVFQDESVFPLVKSTRVCVEGTNPSGVNMCTLDNGTTVTPGYIETRIQTCTSGSINRCGLFRICSGQLAYGIVADINTAFTPGEDMWAEGVYILATLCTYVNAEGKEITEYFNPDGPASDVCFLPSTAQTRSTAPTPTEVITKTIVNPQIQTIASVNPSCFRLARNYPSRGSSSIPSIYQTLLNRPCIIMKNNNVMTVSSTGSLVYTLPNDCRGWGYGDLDGYLSAGLLFWLGSPGRIFGISPIGDYGWIINGSTFSPAQDSYLTTSGQVASGSTINNASINTLQVINEMTSPYPGVNYWLVNIGLTIGSTPASNVVLVAMPVSLELTETYILDRGTCGVITF